MEYITVKIPKTMGDEIDGILPSGFYASRAEFVKDAVRRLLERMNTQEDSEK